MKDFTFSFTFKLIMALQICLFVMPVMAGSDQIIPADREKIFRQVGESVYVECKKQPPFSRNCQVDCGNGMRFQNAKGYCHYLSEGKFVLNVSTRYRNKNYTHIAVVSISEAGKETAMTLNNRKLKEEELKKITAKSELLDKRKIDDDAVTGNTGAVIPLMNQEDTSIIMPEKNNLSDDAVKEISTASIPEVSTGDALQNSRLSNESEIDGNFIANQNAISNQIGFGGIDTQTDNNFGINTPAPSGVFSNENQNLNNQNQISDQFVQQ